MRFFRFLFLSVLFFIPSISGCDDPTNSNPDNSPSSSAETQANAKFDDKIHAAEQSLAAAQAIVDERTKNSDGKELEYAISERNVKQYQLDDLIAAKANMVKSVQADQAKKEEDATAPAPVTDEAVAYAGLNFAKKLVPLSLKCPSTAEFPDNSSASAMPLFTDSQGKTAKQWKVCGYVDSQNSFGAMMRTSWEIIVLDAEGKLFPISAKVGGQPINF